MPWEAVARAAIAAILVLSFGAAAGAKDMVVSSTGARETYDCEGDDIVVNGAQNTLTLRNCDAVSINGADNRVHVGGATKISVLGSGNKVTFTRGDRAPKILNMGVGNTITAGAGTGRDEAAREEKKGGGDTRVSVSEGTAVVVDRGGTVKIAGAGGTVTVDDSGTVKTSNDDLVLADDRQTGTHNCHGGNAVVTGDRNTYSFRDCAKVVISGDRNTIDTRAAATIEVSGDRNTVTWRGERPQLRDSGEHNDITGK